MDWRGSNKGPQRWWRDWSNSPVRKGQKSWDCSAWSREGAGGCYYCIYTPEGRGRRGWSQDLSSGAQWQDQRQWAQTETQKVLSENEETLFYCEGNRALAQVVQGGCGVSVLGDTQKPSGQGPGQQVVLLSSGVGSDDLQRSLPTSTILWFRVLWIDLLPVKELIQVVLKVTEAGSSFSVIDEDFAWSE